MATNRKALGRGIGALIPDAEDGEQSSGSVRELRVEEIRANPEQPRTRFDDATLRELAKSLSVHGVLQPVVVQKSANGEYRLILGERRLRAARIAGLETIPAIVREVDERVSLEMALVENLQREDLNPIDEAHGYEALMEVGGLSQTEVAERVGKDRSTVSNTLRLLELPPDVCEMVSSGTLTAGHGRALLSLETAEARRTFAKRAADRGLSVRELEAAARGRQKRKKVARKKRSEDPVVREWEERLQRALGTLVRIEQLGAEGTIRIEYYSDEDLERILELLGRLEGPVAM